MPLLASSILIGKMNGFRSNPPINANQSPAKVPAAPSGPAPSQGVRTTARAAPPPQDNEIAYGMADLEGALVLKSTDASEANLETRKLDVFTERGVVKGGVAGDVTYMIDRESNQPFRADVEKVCCNRVASLRFGLCVRNLTLASVLAGPDMTAAASARDLVLSQCDAARLGEEYDSAMNTSLLRSTARVFPREVTAWALMTIDEHDVARMRPSGTPARASKSLKRIKLPDVPKG